MHQSIKEEKETWHSKWKCEKIQFMYFNFNNNKSSLTIWVTVTSCRSNILQTGIPYTQRHRLVFLRSVTCAQRDPKKGRGCLCHAWSTVVWWGQRCPCWGQTQVETMPGVGCSTCHSCESMHCPTGPPHREGSTCFHPWDTEASPQIPLTYKQANILICNWYKWHAGDIINESWCKAYSMPTRSAAADFAVFDLQFSFFFSF